MRIDNINSTNFYSLQSKTLTLQKFMKYNNSRYADLKPIKSWIKYLKESVQKEKMV